MTIYRSPAVTARRRARNRRWLRLAVLAVAIYLGATYGWPRVREWLSGTVRRSHGDPSDTDDGAVRACLAQAQRALRHFRDKASTREESGVQLNWREAMRLVDSEIDKARRACECDADACVVASDALATLRAESDTFEATMVRGGAMPDLEARLDRVDRQLQRARAGG